MARKMPKTMQSWLIPRLRRISLWWPGKSIARDQAKVKVEVGKTKRGKPLFRVFYKCALCVKENKSILWKKEETNMDHINSVINVEGFKNWDEAISRLFCEPDGYQCLCLNHHDLKTKRENKQRKKNRERNNSK